ncbi:amidase [Kineococcus sp. SYSU DK003]|uniref:amidase n=1 Tax=Kineococcus sp. SYSU DK003 TaxID=3383124 RepID=UPI003D7CF610
MTTTELATEALALTPTSGAPVRTITDAAAALRGGTTTAVELVQSAITHADALDGLLGVYLHRTDAAALQAAEAVDRAFAAGQDLGPLAGIPLGIKDILSVQDTPTTSQSLVMDPAFAEKGDAVVVARLKAAGGIITGKTTTMEYAVGCPDPDKPFPIPRNPWNTDHWTGGSSSGTGNGVAAGMFLGGLGTDTGGSVRYPSALCGISGIKQTFGLVPKSGCTPLGFSYDNIGPMARTVRDCALMLGVMAGHDASDPTSVDVTVPDYTAALTGDVTGLRVGVATHLLDLPGFDPDNAALFRAAAEEFAAAGADVVEVQLPNYAAATAATTYGFCAEAFAYHRKDLQDRWQDYGIHTRRALVNGMLFSAADYVQAQRVRRATVKALSDLMAEVDILLTPTTMIAAPALEGLDFDLVMATVLTPYFNAVGTPAMSIPMGFTSAGLPVGLQVAGRPFEESTVFRAADAYQQRTTHHLAVPALVQEVSA